MPTDKLQALLWLLGSVHYQLRRRAPGQRRRKPLSRGSGGKSSSSHSRPPPQAPLRRPLPQREIRGTRLPRSCSKGAQHPRPVHAAGPVRWLGGSWPWLGPCPSGLAGSRGVADPRPATRDPGRNQRPANRDPERPGPPGPARTYPVRPGHTRPGPDICQDRDFKIIFDCKISECHQ